MLELRQSSSLALLWCLSIERALPGQFLCFRSGPVGVENGLESWPVLCLTCFWRFALFAGAQCGAAVRLVDAAGGAVASENRRGLWQCVWGERSFCG